MLAACCGLGALVAARAPASGAAAARTVSARRNGAAAGQLQSAGLAQAWTDAQGSWAVVPMGHLGHPHNTFWQVLFRPAGAQRWRLVTPPGVATNGGISVAAGSSARGPVTVGIQPTDLLRFSPLARTADAGRTWSSGLLPSGLADVADAVATGPAGAAYALVRSGHGTLLRAEGTLTAWTKVVTTSALAATSAGRACGVSALDAVGVAAGGPLLGAACTHPGVVGLFQDTGGSWRLVGPSPRSLPKGAAAAREEVLRVTAGASGTGALVEASGPSARGVSLLAMSRAAGARSWSVSEPVRIDGQLLSSDEEGGHVAGVVVGSGSRATAVLVLEAAAAHAGARRLPAWKVLARPPAGTQAVVEGTGEIVALASSGSELEVWRLVATRWARSEQLRVPIRYGSST